MGAFVHAFMTMGIRAMFQIVGTVAPFIGALWLGRKTPNRVEQDLMIANIGCMVMNAGYFHLLRLQDYEALLLSWRLSFSANILFYHFFAFFVLDYLQVKYPRGLRWLWGWAEVLSVLCLWSDTFLHLMASDQAFTPGTVRPEDMRSGPLYVLLFCITCFTLGIGILYTLLRFFQSHVARERRNVGILVIAQLVVFISLVVRLLVRLPFDFVPILAAVSVMPVNHYILRGEFFTVADTGRDWVFEHIDDGFVIVDTCFGYLDSNECANAIFPELRGYRKSKQVSPELYRMFEAGEEEVKLGDRYYLHPVTILREGKERVGYCLMLQDVTESHLLMEQLVEAKDNAERANQAKSAFLSNMSHEIRTPMNAIVGMSEILLRGEHAPQDRTYLESIQSSGMTLLTIINDILDISKVEAGKLEIVEGAYEPAAMLRDLRLIIQNRIGGKPVELIFDVDETLPRRLVGDSLRLRQVIINIMNNAVKFTEKGYVKLTIQVLGAEEDKVELRFAVRDTGQGIREEDLGKLFGAFSQVDQQKNHSKEGTGLGLSISKQLVELMGGAIGVESVYGEGSEFWFTVSQKIADGPEEAEAPEGAEQAGAFTAPDARVLVVDDNEMNLTVAQGLLEPLHMHIDTASDGSEALDKIARERYDLVLMDHMMPVMDGVEATQRLRAMEDEYFRKVPVIALTANALADARQSFAEAGMNDFVAKPIQMAEICAKLRRWLPPELVREAEDAAAARPEQELPSIEGLDVAEGVRNTGTYELYLRVLDDFCRLIDKKADKIEHCADQGLWRDYTVEVHALKSTARTVGAAELSRQCALLEQYGSAEDAEAIGRDTPAALELYRSYKPVLEEFLHKEPEEKRDVPVSRLIQKFEMVRHGVDQFDMDTVDAVMAELEQYRMPESCRELFEALRTQTADMAMEEMLETAGQILERLDREEA